MSIFTGWKTATLFCLFLIGWLADQRYPVLPTVLQQHAPYRHGVQVSPEQQDILGIIRTRARPAPTVLWNGEPGGKHLPEGGLLAAQHLPKT